jgi:Cdc6-like AAA superfamily ATPase
MEMILRKLADFLPSPYRKVSTEFTHRDIKEQFVPSNDINPFENNVRMSQDSTAFQLGEHWTVAGATGAGKTVFSKELMEQFRRKFPLAKRYVLNSTGDPQLEDMIGAVVHAGNTPPPKPRQHETMVWTPDTDDMGAYNEWLLSLLYAREKSVILLDDIASLVGYGRTISILDGHMKLMKQGRKHGITVINGTQEMTRVPLMMFRQMTHFVQLRLSNDPIDLAYARKYLNIQKEEQEPPHSDYGFFYKRVGVKFPHEEYDSYTQFFHKRKRE